MQWARSRTWGMEMGTKCSHTHKHTPKRPAYYANVNTDTLCKLRAINSGTGVTKRMWNKSVTPIFRFVFAIQQHSAKHICGRTREEHKHTSAKPGKTHTHTCTTHKNARHSNILELFAHIRTHTHTLISVHTLTHTQDVLCSFYLFSF